MQLNILLKRNNLQYTFRQTPQISRIENLTLC